MENIKVVIRYHEEEYVRYLAEKKKGDNSQHTKLRVQNEKAFINGMFIALSATMNKTEYLALCDWDYALLEELYKMYGID